MVSSGMPNTDEIRDRMMPQILNILIEERLKVQEAGRLGIDVTEEEIAVGFSSIAKQNNYSIDQFTKILNKQGITTRTLEDQIRSQIAWTRVVQNHLGSQVKVNKTDIIAMRERLESNSGKTEYLVSEIFLPVETTQEESDVKQVADRLTRQILEKKAPFQRVAVQFSQSAGATSGGDMGWVQEGQLQEDLDAQLSTMSKGNISKHIRTLSG